MNTFGPKKARNCSQAFGWPETYYERIAKEIASTPQTTWNTHPKAIQLTVNATDPLQRAVHDLIFVSQQIIFAEG